MASLQAIDLSTPFWEFRILEIARMAELYSAMHFLLPFGSFVVVIGAGIYGGIEWATFYSLLGVSDYTQDLFGHLWDCMPFYSLLGVSLYVYLGLFAPCIQVAFLLPFGSFISVYKRINGLNFNIIPFYSLLGVSEEV